MTLSRTKNSTFDQYGFLKVENILSDEIITEMKDHTFISAEITNQHEYQVIGSEERYFYKPFVPVHYYLKERLENIIGKKLYETYFFDRIYYPGQELKRHTDRPSCEISVSVNISTNIKEKWDICFESYDKGHYNLSTNPGDGVIYKGVEIPHWRNEMPGVKEDKVRKFFKRPKLYYHQIFFHYVLQDGIFCHHAWDYINRTKMIK